MTTANANTCMRANAQPKPYPVNLRVTIPFYPRSLFVTLIIGQERRGTDRLREERERHPVNTWGNLFVVVGAWSVFVVATLFAAFVASGL
jgi:hypothetical protein